MYFHNLPEVANYYNLRGCAYEHKYEYNNTIIHILGRHAGGLGDQLLEFRGKTKGG